MPHVMTMFDPSEMLYAYDLAGRDVVVEIERVWGGELTGEKGRKTKKPFVKFKGKEKTLALNKTNAKALIRMFGSNTDRWVGKLITIFPTTTEMNGETKECIRIRPEPARARASRDKHGNELVEPPLSDEERKAIELAEREGA